MEKRINSILSEARKQAIPTKHEAAKVGEIAEEVVQSVSARAYRFGAKLVVGGSVAKSTWLPGLHDIDCFLQFDYKKYKDRSDELADVAEKIIKNCFDSYQRLHGSRDYFQVKYLGYDIEIIPVLEIAKPDMMKNITDVSPLHFVWLSRKTRKLKLEDDVRLAKTFFKANQLYGAESYIRGFSGHVIEILTVHYGGFLKLLKEISRWKDRVIVDAERKYMNEKQLMLLMNSSKLVSPLIVVDPIQPERNASAVVSAEKFELAEKAAKKFLANPSSAFFREKEITAQQIKSRKSKNRLILLSAKPEKGVTIDVAGCQLLKQFEYAEKLLTDFDFKIAKKSWFWNKKKDAIFWFYINPKKLSESFRHWGPPANLKEHAAAFKKQWSKYKIGQSKGKLYVDFPRKVRTVDDFLKELRKDRKLNVRIL